MYRPVEEQAEKRAAMMSHLVSDVLSFTGCVHITRREQELLDADRRHAGTVWHIARDMRLDIGYTLKLMGVVQKKLLIQELKEGLLV